MDKETNQMPSLTGILSALESSAGLLFFFKKKIRKQPRKERSLRSFSIISTQTESQRARIGGCSSNKKSPCFHSALCISLFALINQTSITTYLISRHTISFDGIDLEKEKKWKQLKREWEIPWVLNLITLLALSEKCKCGYDASRGLGRAAASLLLLSLFTRLDSWIEILKAFCKSPSPASWQILR